ncbi:MAG: hypothetical protein J2P19_17540 [Pseudonocardia sp.]|nr:hypothetical protein [Pseudonocardia sp.]
MCSNRLEGWQPPPAPAIAGHAAPAEVPRVRPVWVLLEEVVRHDPAVASTVVDGLELTGRAKGFLREWRRGSRGDWVGVVNYEVHYADGRETTVWWQDQMVPAYALLPRSTR